uniref:DISC1 scaffold protein n=1 Tax=Esox lucius TaxID=8010 RepID=A0A6Q2X1M5_ESOLU
MFSGLLRRESHNNYDDTDIGCGAKEHHRCPSGMEGDSVIAPPFVSAGSSIRKRLEQHRRPGYLRTESSTIQSTQAGEEGRTACQTNGASGCALLNGHSDVIKFGSCDSVSQQHCSLERDGPEPETYRPKAQSSSSAPRLLSLSHPPLSQEGCCGTNCSSSSSWTTPPINPRLTPGSESCLRQHHPCRSSGSSSSSRDTPFSSSFSFIQQSLNPCLDPDLCPDPYPDPDPELKPLKRCSVHVDPKPLNISSVLNQSSALTSKPIFPSGSVSLSQSGLQSDSLDQSPSTSGSSQSRLGVLELSFGLSVSKLSTPTSVQSQISSISLDQSKNSFIPINQSEIRSIPLSDKDRRLEVLSPWVWQDRHWESVGLGVKLTHSATSDLAETEPDCDLFTLDTEAASSLSVGEDSDAASASSLTSGYESATPTAATKGPAQDHTHDHTHEHTHDHTLDHTHGLAQDHTLDHTHGHTQDYTHDHTHSHTQDHTHDHTHNHTHDHNQDHTHNHTHDHNQDHTHDHTHDWDQGFWDQLVKKYDGILQDCLRDNQTNTKIESKMLKLQRLQQKAIQEDDYDSAERFDKKLEELGRERGSLRLVLPSRLPSIALFLQRLREAVHTSLSRMEDQRGEVEHDGGAEANTTAEDPQQRRERLQQEKHQVEVEIAELQCRLGELQSRNCSLELLIQHEEADLEAEELEGPALRSCSHAQLKVMGRALNDMVTSQNRSRICVSPPASIHRLQEQQQALSLSIKDATAKVVMSQRLAGRLQRKVSETETQLLALHEAKLAAISGNDFSSAKELKAEMGAVYRERERLELLVKRLHSLSSGNSRELGRMKTQHTQLKEELSSRQAQHGEWRNPAR